MTTICPTLTFSDKSIRKRKILRKSRVLAKRIRNDISPDFTTLCTISFFFVPLAFIPSIYTFFSQIADAPHIHLKSLHSDSNTKLFFSLVSTKNEPQISVLYPYFKSQSNENKKPKYIMSKCKILKHKKCNSRQTCNDNSRIHRILFL